MPPAINNNDLTPLNVPIRLEKETQIVCSYKNCGKTFKRQAKLIEHERVHTGEVNKLLLWLIRLFFIDNVTNSVLLHVLGLDATRHIDVLLI